MKRLLFSVAALAMVVSGCGRKAAAPPTPPPVPVDTAQVVAQDVPIEILTIGTVEAIASVQLKAKVGGEVQRVEFADGDTVKAGQTLFVIDPRPYEVANQRAEANLTIARAQAQNAADQLARYSTLSTKGAASQEQFSQFRSTAQQQNAEVAARQADLAEAALSLSWATVSSPINGRAGAALVKAGNIVQAESEVLTVINQLQPIYVSLAIPEAQLNEVRRRMAGSPIRVTARDPVTGKELQEGVVAFVDNAVDVQSGMFTSKAAFANADESLWPGQFVDVRVTLGQDAGALVLPSVAILESQSGPRVFVVKDGVVSLREVEVDRTFGSQTVIRKGVAAGDTVVTSGQLRLTDGAKVTVTPATTDPEKS